MRKRWLLAAPLAAISAGALFYFATRPEQATPLPPSSVPLATQTIEEKVQEETIPESEERPKLTGTILMSGDEGLTFNSRVMSVPTYNAKLFLVGKDQLPTGLDREGFYDAAAGMGKIMDIYPKLNATEGEIEFVNRIARITAPQEVRESHETTIMRRDILENWASTSQIIIDQNLIPGYSDVDTDYITTTLGEDGALRDRYPINTMTRFEFTPGYDGESGSVSITDYHLKKEDDGTVTAIVRDDWGTRTYQDSPEGSFRSWYNGATLRTIEESERSDALVGGSHMDVALKKYQEGPQLAVK